MFFRLKNFRFSGKNVLMRVDFNVPLDDKGKILDDSRIVKTLPTLRYILKQKPKKIILLSHLGRPEGEIDLKYSLKPVYKRLKAVLKHEVYFEPKLAKDVNNLPDGISLLENIRFCKEEVDNDKKFARKLAELADYFVFDAFGVSHREQASVSAVQEFLPSCSGLLLEKELRYLVDYLKNPKRPFVAIIGGAKADKISVLNNLFRKIDKLIAGGVLANTFLKAKGIDIGSSKYSPELLENVKKLLKKYHAKIILPVDFILGNKFSEDAKVKYASSGDNLEKWLIMDIGVKTIALYEDALGKSKTVVWAGPIGVFEWEKFSKGTARIAKHIAKLEITKIVGGGDSVEAVESLKLGDKMTHVSTGGGASLELLAGHKLPGVEALKKNYLMFQKY